MDLARLVIAARAGDQAAYGAIVRRFQDMAYGGAYALLGDADEARDAAQEAFVEAWLSLAKLRQPAAFPGWFRRIVFKQADRILRQRKETVGGEVLARIAQAGPDPLAQYERGATRDLVQAAVASLPASQRLPLTLYHLRGYDQGEVAAFLDLSKSTVKKRIFDARRILHERINAMVGETLNQGRPSRDDGFARRVEFFVAFNERDVDAMERLIDRDPSLLEATGDWECAPELRSAGWDANAARWAARIGHVDMLAMLLDKGADVDNPEKHGDTLLHIAVMYGHAEVVRLLLKRKANVNASGGCHHTPLHRAVMRGETGIAQGLVAAGAELELGDSRGRTAADWAAMKGRAGLLEWLVEQGAAKPARPLRVPLVLKPKRPGNTRAIPGADAALGRVLSHKGAVADGGEKLSGPQETVPSQAEGDVSSVLQTGIKAIDLLAPFRRGGQVGIEAGMGVGKSLLVEQIARNFVESYRGRVVYVGANEAEISEWSSFVGDGKLLVDNSVHVQAGGDNVARRQAAETGLGLAEQYRQQGHDVLLYVAGQVALSPGVLPLLRTQVAYSPQAAITVCYLGHIPHGLDEGRFAFLDTAVYLDRTRAGDGLFPAVDLQQSRSRLLEEGLAAEDHVEAAARGRACLRQYERQNLGSTVANGRVRPAQISHVDNQDQAAVERLVGRARRLSYFLTQPYHGTEMWVGEPGETVLLEDTIQGVGQILDGMHDGVPERAFLNVGMLAQVVHKAAGL